MKILNIILVSILSLVITTQVQAKANENMIACPSIETIHKIAPRMKKAEVDNYGKQIFLAQISDVQSNGFLWYVVAHNIIANNKKEATAIAKQRSLSVNHVFYPNARTGAPRGDEYSCLYYDDTQADPYVSILAIKKYGS